ncbi:hypothetical protein CLOACE_06440 [Clostridium acetireducens DSM 10703]|jgi:hypothetical protein|uniref:Uncharacterized protein n=1 Tax=Clostridium acetireducens DSM 10703 TaxID=1121290 RepID=A0A1E8F0C8_9CLOT|nr:DUF4652 domain-containing protein [Clostridium acetireducens]OFI06851.1 hypothetical protein CLOACE_06440 [Clostridium acetireducens DSM 10703]
MNFMKNKPKNNIVSYFVILILLVFSFNIIGCSKDNETNNNVSKEKVTTNEQKSNNDNKEKINREENSSKDKETSKNILKNTDVKFDKKELEKENSINFNTPWESSPNGKLFACIEGKGESAQEEGIGKVCVKDLQNNIFSFEIVSSKKQLSPKDLEWLDDENVLVVIGHAYGTISKGGNIYVLNTNTGECNLLYDTKDNKREIISCKVESRNSKTANIKINMNIYEDDNFTKDSVKTLFVKNMDLNFNSNIDILDKDGNIFDTIK